MPQRYQEYPPEVHSHRIDQAKTPYASALRAHAGRRPTMFMVPGHAATADGLTTELSDFAGAQAISMDIPQLIEGIDVGPMSPFAQAEALAAEAWNARRAWFLANGSSQGNRIAVIATAGLNPAGCIIAQRSAHSSLSDGLIISGLVPRFIAPNIDAERGINHGVTPESLQQAFDDASASGQVVTAAQVVSPSYFGAVADIATLTEVAHANGAALIVDAAWGAHFGFHPDLPKFPTAFGADLIVTSVHKMGGGLGQSAMILLGEGPFAARFEPLVERAFQLTQSTSASSLLLGSLDVARHSLVFGQHQIEQSIRLAEVLRAWARRHDVLDVVSDSFSQHPDIVGHDPLRVSIDVADCGMTGYEMRSLLAERGIYLEIATASAIVAFFGPGKPLDIDALTGALDEIIARPCSRALVNTTMASLPAAGPARLTPRDAYFSRTEIVPAERAVGRISADALSAYPPGIPNILPGEEITADAIGFLQSVAASPIGYIRGALNPNITLLRVVAPQEENA